MATSKNLITGKRNNKNDAPVAAPAKPEAPKVEAQAVDEEAELKALKIELAQAKAELQRAQTKGGTSIKVSTKGCVSVYGLGRFPVSFYKSQWEKLFSMKDAIESFIEQHKDLLPEKSAAKK